jgi:hypothetical protein
LAWQRIYLSLTSLGNWIGYCHGFCCNLDLPFVDRSCSCVGTRIATPQGVILVEDLRPGDRLRTVDGGVTMVKWLGEQPVNVRLSNPAKVNAICITADAL